MRPGLRRCKGLMNSRLRRAPWPAKAHFPGGNGCCRDCLEAAAPVRLSVARPAVATKRVRGPVMRTSIKPRRLTSRWSASTPAGPALRRGLNVPASPRRLRLRVSTASGRRMELSNPRRNVGNGGFTLRPVASGSRTRRSVRRQGRRLGSPMQALPCKGGNARRFRCTSPPGGHPPPQSRTSRRCGVPGD